MKRVDIDSEDVFLGSTNLDYFVQNVLSLRQVLYEGQKVIKEIKDRQKKLGNKGVDIDWRAERHLKRLILMFERSPDCKKLLTISNAYLDSYTGPLSKKRQDSIGKYERNLLEGRQAEEEELSMPCSCGHNRWRTLKKGERWQCRKCGKVRKNNGNRS